MIKKIISVAINAFFRFLPINQKKIVFQSTRYKVTDNPYYIYKYIKDNNLDYKLVFIVDKNADVSNLANGDFAYVRSLKAYYHLATYKYLFTCQSLGSILKKRKNQIYIQLWHSISLKKMGLDISNPDNLARLEHTLDWDYVVSSSEFESRVLKSSSGYTCKTKLLGNPRTDALFKHFDIPSIKAKLGIADDKKIVLYAPTFRDWELDKDNIGIDLPNNITDNYTVLIRLHPLIAQKIDKNLFTDNVINACDYSNLNELLALADILITDYSSICFDYSLLHKPTIFYAYDYKEYSESRGGLYLDFNKDLPGPVAFSKNELYQLFENIDEVLNEFAVSTEEFNRKYSTMNDGNVCQRIIHELQNGGFNI